MDLPRPPALRNLEAISPTFYNAALLCKARAAWQQFSAWQSLPAPTGSILGSCFHRVMEIANQGRLPTGEEGARQANSTFDREATRLLAEAHPLIRAKFATPDKLPFFFQRRARATTIALQALPSAPAHPPNSQPARALQPAPSTEWSRLVERTLSTRDGLIKGRIDFWSKSTSAVTDYKSGYEPKNPHQGMADDEIRQMRLYVHLVLENGYTATKAIIQRGDASQSSIAVSAAEAEREGQAARQALAQFNQAIASGHSFSALASPSPASCVRCPCIALCDPFWQAAQPDWEPSCGTNVEGEVAESRDASFAGAPLRTLALKSCRGSAPHGSVVVEQIPLQWLSLGERTPGVGDVIRVVSAIRATAQPDTRVLQVDRARNTAIWSAPGARRA